MARHRGNNKQQQQQQQHKSSDNDDTRRRRGGGGGGGARRPAPKIVDHVTESDDEEIDEDEAFNSEDERLYGHFFNQQDDDDDDDDDDDEEDGEESENEKEEDGDNNETKPSAKKKSKTLDWSEDEEMTSDEGEDDSDSDSDEEEDDDDNDDDGGQYMLDLLNKVNQGPGGRSGGGDDNEASNNGKLSVAQMVHLKESDYSAKQGTLGGGLTLDKLMEGIQDTQGFRDLQKTFAKQKAATPAPLAKVLSNRVERKMVYAERSKDISRWTQVVQENRQAETLDFKPKERLGELTRDAIVDKFEAKTDFEKEIAAALEEAGQQDEEAVLKAEEEALQDDLGANRLTMDEYKKRRGQLAQIRALMFYHEQKRHHMKKIKSKKYRRIRKKQRERLKDSAMEAALEEDADLANELKEKEEVARIQERMTLAHKNTSKWAKRVLKRGKNVDVDTRRALSAQLKRGDDLRRKMMGDEEDDDNHDGDSDDEDLVESARKVLQDTEDEPDPTHGKTGLFKLSFMQKGIQKQRAKAQEEARKLLQELEADELDDYDNAISDKGGEGSVLDDGRKRDTKTASAKQMKEVLQSGEMVAASLEFGNSNSIATSGGIEIDIGDNHDEKANSVEPAKEQDGGKAKPGNQGNGGTSQFVATMKINTVEEPSPRRQSRKRNANEKPSSEHKKPNANVSVAVNGWNMNAEDEANPWMQSSDTPATSVTSKLKRSIRAKGMVDVEGAIDMLDAKDSNKAKTFSTHFLGVNATENKATEAPKDCTEKKITMLSQEELVRQAFVGQNEKEIEEEFQLEKEAVAEESNPIRKVEKDKSTDGAAGWGSWTGQGTLPPKPRRFPHKFQPPKAKKDDNKRKRLDAKKPDVIINQKRIKKTANQFMLGDVPHPYSSRAEYEQAMLGGVGKEWNVSSSFKSMTRPEILTRSGKIIQPISKKAKAPRAAAKF